MTGSQQGPPPICRTYWGWRVCEQALGQGIRRQGMAQIDAESGNAARRGQGQGRGLATMLGPGV